jgi:hypothetical protein
VQHFDLDAVTDNEGGFDQNAAIDDARVYNRALSASEVQTLYNYTGGGSPTTAIDSSGNGNTGTFENTPTWTTGKINGALTFNGLTAPNGTDVKINTNFLSGSNAFTITAWVNSSSQGGVGWILGDQATGCMIAGSGSAYLDCTDNTGGGPDVQSPGGSFTLNQWNFVAASRNSSGQWTLYINGVQSGTANQAAAAPSDSYTSMYIGGRATDESLNGTIDDLRVYSRILSATEILSLYNTDTLTTEGELMYNSTSHIPQFCDGTAWHATQ